MKLLLPLFCLCLVGCGEAEHILAGPSAVVPPLPAMNITGRWDGQVTLLFVGQRVIAPVTLKLTQAGSSVTGWWSAQARTDIGIVAGQDAGGEVNGTLSGNAFTGTVTWDSERVTGGRCTGVSGLSGTVTRERADLIAASVPLAGCQSPTTVTWVVIPTSGTIR